MEVIEIPDSPVKLRKTTVGKPEPQSCVIIDDSPVKRKSPNIEKGGKFLNENPGKTNVNPRQNGFNGRSNYINTV